MRYGRGFGLARGEALMPWWAWLAGSLVLGIWFWRVTFRTLIATDIFGPASKEIGLTGVDFMLAAVFSTLIFPAAPLLLFFVAVKHLVGGWGDLARVMGGETRAQKRERKEAELAEREEKVARMERELGIT
jgi:hypothetical protein